MLLHDSVALNSRPTTVSMESVHRTTPSEVIPTGWKHLSDQRFLVSGSWNLRRLVQGSRRKYAERRATLTPQAGSGAAAGLTARNATATGFNSYFAALPKSPDL